MGLIGGMARTAVIAGTATAVSNRVSRRQANRWAQQDPGYDQQQGYQEPQPQYYAQPAPAPAPAPAAAAEPDPISQIRQLADMKAQGILTDEEFQAAKAKILAAP